MKRVVEYNGDGSIWQTLITFDPTYNGGTHCRKLRDIAMQLFVDSENGLLKVPGRFSIWDAGTVAVHAEIDHDYAMGMEERFSQLLDRIYQTNSILRYVEAARADGLL